MDVVGVAATDDKLFGKGYLVKKRSFDGVVEKVLVTIIKIMETPTIFVPLPTFPANLTACVFPFSHLGITL